MSISPSRAGDSPDLLVAGGGVIGLSCAWRASQAGLRVLVADPSFGRGASWAAAGMIVAVGDPQPEDSPELSMRRRSAELWPGFRDEVEEAAGQDIAYSDTGTLIVACDAAGAVTLRGLFDTHQRLGLASSWLGRSERLQAEPLLSESVEAGVLAPFDHSVDPRRLVGALASACRSAGVSLVESAVVEVSVDGERVVGATLAGGREVRARWTLLAAGSASPSPSGLPPIAVPPVLPVKGQILRLRAASDSLRPRRTVRALGEDFSRYIAMRPDGEIVCGATVEAAGEDLRPTAGAVYELVRDAIRVVPSLLEAELLEVTARLRPGSPDGAPMIGLGALDGLLVATGHYRNGILLAPVTAHLVVGLLSGGAHPPWASAFDPRRFSLPAV